MSSISSSSAELCLCRRRRRLSPESSRPAPWCPQRASPAMRSSAAAALKPLVFCPSSANFCSSRRPVSGERFFSRGIFSSRPTFGDGTGAAEWPFGGRRHRSGGSTAVRCSWYEDQQQQHGGGDLPRPPVIQWEPDLANAVQLIGNVGRDIDLRYLDSGSIVARTSLAVKKKKKTRVIRDEKEEPSWFEIELWDALAQIAAHHVKKGEQIFVTGRITVEKWVKDDIRYSSVKVLVRDLCFVEPFDSRRQLDGQSSGFQQNGYLEMGSNNFAQETPSTSSPQSWDPYSSPDSSPSQGTTVQREKPKTQDDIGTEKRWQEYFADPTQWWDNRTNKRNPKAPDFKHKSTQEVLWLNSWNNPPWVIQQIAALEEKRDGDFTSSGLRFQEQHSTTTRMRTTTTAPFPGGQASLAEAKMTRGDNLLTRATRTRRAGATVRMAPDDEKMTRRSPLDFPLEWERPTPGRRADIFPQFSPMKTPLPTPMPADPPEEDEEEDEEKKEEDPEKEDKPEE